MTDCETKEARGGPPSPQSYSHIFWDWNGTLLDDVASCIKSINLLLAKRGLSPLDKAAYASIFGFPVIDYYRRAGFDFNADPYELLAREYIENYNEAAKGDSLTAGAKAALTELSRRGVKQYILSASEMGMLKDGLAKHGIKELFSDVIGCSDIYAGGKLEMARRWLASRPPKKRPQAGAAVLVGDTVHDFEVAKALGFDCLLYSGGHGTQEALEKTGAPVFSSLTEILDYLVRI